MTPGPHSSRTFQFFLGAVAFTWTIFQLYVASPVPYVLGQGFILGSGQSRLIHYAFAIFLVFLTTVTVRRCSWAASVPSLVLALVSAACALYLFILYDELARRSGAPTTLDIVVAYIGIVTLLEAIRRSIGLSLVVVAVVFLLYCLTGRYLPDSIAHRGASISRLADHIWLSNQGIFGFALSVSSSLVFLFVLFGALLEKAGAGNWFIQTSFALMGHLRGGPAKAAVVSSALTGMISGSALANVVTTGTFTIPLMKRVGFPAAKAAGIESTSSINGQLMPPVMGAAAFLMTEFVGIPYSDVIKHAFVPAVISYIGLIYIVHIEAHKLGIPMLESTRSRSLLNGVTMFTSGFLAMLALAFLVFHIANWIKADLAEYALWTIIALIAVIYISLLWVSTRVPRIAMESPDSPLIRIPEFMPTFLSGIHYLIPVVVLIWFMMVERLSPALSVVWAILSISIIIVTQDALSEIFRGESNSKGLLAALLTGLHNLGLGMIDGARNMAGIALALASAGIVVGAISLTGVSLMMVGLIEALSGGNVMIMLLIVAVVTIILGMGLPTTANYVVVASLMVPIVVSLSSQNGLLIPLIAVHFFVFYCGLMSGNTPPVAVDAYAAASLAKSDPMATCVQAFYYGIRTIVLPFIFVFNTELLLIGVDNILHATVIFATSLVAMLVFVAATQGFFLVRNRPWETAVLLLVTFSLFRPVFWVDQIIPRFAKIAPAEVEASLAALPDESLVRLSVEGLDFIGDPVSRTVVFSLEESGGDGLERLRDSTGLMLGLADNEVVVENVDFNSQASAVGIDFDWTVTAVEIPNERFAKEWVYLPAAVLLGLVMLLQTNRRRKAGLEEGLP